MTTNDTTTTCSPGIARFKHEPLRSARDQFRLLQFNAGSRSPGPAWLFGETKEQTLRFDLHPYPRTACPAYIAVSYTWGSTEDPADIIANGMSLTIRRNLFEFLRILSQQQAHRNTHFWIDQICIDQSSEAVVERSLQVQCMDLVFSEADKVFAWLGPAREEHNFVWNTLCETWMRPRAKKDKYDLYYVLSEEQKPWFISFINRDYWQRLWIVQEVLLARKLVIWYGNHSTDGIWLLGNVLKLPDMGRESGLLTNADDDQRASGSTQLTLMSLASTRLKYADEIPRLSLAHAVSTYRRQLCSDLRDLVFGVQALVRPEQRIVVDYTQSSEQLFQTTLKLLMQLNGLHLAVAMKLWDRLTGLPTPPNLKPNIKALLWSHRVGLLPMDQLATGYSCMVNLSTPVTSAQKRLVYKCIELLKERALRRPNNHPMHHSPYESLPVWVTHQPDWTGLAGDGQLRTDIELLYRTGYLRDLKNILLEAGEQCGFMDVDGFLVHRDDPHPDCIVTWQEKAFKGR